MDKVCVSTEHAFQGNQSMADNPINNYSEIQGMLASKTIMDGEVFLSTAGIGATITTIASTIEPPYLLLWKK